MKNLLQEGTTINRREFLKIGLALAVVINPTISKAQAIIGKKAIFSDINHSLSDTELNHHSLSKLKKNEQIFFLNYFGLIGGRTNAIEKKIIELQRKFNIKATGVLGEQTLKHIYLYYYSKESVLPREVKERLAIYNEMSKYKSYNSKAQTQKLNVFSEKTFYGVSDNVIDSYYEKKLMPSIEDNTIPFFSTENNIIKFFNINGKTVLAMYLDGKLHLLTHATPGKKNSKTPAKHTTGERQTSMYYVSNTFPKESNGGAVMPYAVHVFKGIFIHGSDGKIDGNPHSKGCIRVGLFYMREIYKQVSNLGIKNVLIDTIQIY